MHNETRRSYISFCQRKCYHVSWCIYNSYSGIYTTFYRDETFEVGFLSPGTLLFLKELRVIRYVRVKWEFIAVTIIITGNFQGIQFSRVFVGDQPTRQIKISNGCECTCAKIKPMKW